MTTEHVEKKHSREFYAFCCRQGKVQPGPVSNQGLAVRRQRNNKGKESLVLSNDRWFLR